MEKVQVFRFSILIILILGLSIQEGHGQAAACQACLLLCGPCDLCVVLCDQFDSDSQFLPKDGGTLNSGIRVFPTPMKMALTREPTAFVVNENSNFGPTCPFSNSQAIRLINSLERVVQFYEENYQQLNRRTDGGVGLSILTGQLLNVLPKLGVDENHKDLRIIFSKLLELSTFLGPKIFEYAMNAEKIIPPYFNGMKIMINRTKTLRDANRQWKSSKLIHQHTHEFNKIGDEPEVIYPLLDFQCMVSVVRNCDVPHVCKKLYLEDIYSQYMLTHQILLVQFATEFNCLKTNPENFPADVEQYHEKLCSKAYLEAEFIEGKNFPVRWRDLFAEHIAFCGMGGFPNFFRSDWLDEVLSWQSSSTPGCFTNIYERGENGVLSTDVGIDAQVTNTKGEKVTESCLIHFTSVNLAALALNLRYMVDHCDHDIFKDAN